MSKTSDDSLLAHGAQQTVDSDCVTVGNPRQLANSETCGAKIIAYPIVDRTMLTTSVVNVG